jgi:hypothetical protein
VELFEVELRSLVLAIEDVSLILLLIDIKLVLAEYVFAEILGQVVSPYYVHYEIHSLTDY